MVPVLVVRKDDRKMSVGVQNVPFSTPTAIVYDTV